MYIQANGEATGLAGHSDQVGLEVVSKYVCPGNGGLCCIGEEMCCWMDHPFGHNSKTTSINGCFGPEISWGHQKRRIWRHFTQFGLISTPMNTQTTSQTKWSGTGSLAPDPPKSPTCEAQRAETEAYRGGAESDPKKHVCCHPIATNKPEVHNKITQKCWTCSRTALIPSVSETRRLQKWHERVLLTVAGCWRLREVCQELIWIVKWS